MPVTVAVTFFQVVVAIHVMAAVMAFGVTFALPIIFAVAAKQGPRSLPLLHRIEVSLYRRLVNPGLTVVVVAGIYLASHLHLWSTFFVQWGMAMAIVIGAGVGSITIPNAKRAAALADRDIAATEDERPAMSADYAAIARRLAVVGYTLSLLVLVTIYFMVTRTGA